MRRAALFATALLAAALLWRQLAPVPAAAPGAPARLILERADERAGFARALSPRRFELPRDHGPHFEYQTEWWYYTGNLTSAAGERYGYQLAVFRRGLSPGPPPEADGLATNQVYFAHLAVTDAARGTHSFAERWSRGAPGLAGASATPYRVAIEGWSIEGLDATGDHVGLLARDGAIGLELRLRATKPIVAHGERGLSAKSEEAGNASYYLSYTRMASAGTLRVRGQDVAVTGESWFDHEWSTSALGPEAVGWDWFSLQLDDGRELMLFQIRRRDGSPEPVSGGTLVAASGSTRRLAAGDVSLAALARWTSPDGQATYPSRWALGLPSESLELNVVPLVPDQELKTSFRYWEGAVSVSGTFRGQPIRGRGYVELTGYAAPMAGLF